LFTRFSLSARSCLVGIAIVGVCAAVCVPVIARSPATTRSARFSANAWSGVEQGTIDPAVFDMALGAVACAVRSGSIEDPSTLTVIDYSRPSTAKRLWVFDLHARALLYEELVAHGKGSGENLATRFSNEPDSHQSSLGLFLTEDAYVGRNGYSLRLRGLDEGFNDRAYERAIVMHGAPYVSDDVARTNGRLGRSWGCPALREGVARAVIDRVKGTGLVFAYYPDSAWLKGSKYLSDCAGVEHGTQ
jgi:L,D-transpeptidase catalytic domain